MQDTILYIDTLDILFQNKDIIFNEHSRCISALCFLCQCEHLYINLSLKNNQNETRKLNVPIYSVSCILITLMGYLISALSTEYRSCVTKQHSFGSMLIAVASFISPWYGIALHKIRR